MKVGLFHSHGEGWTGGETYLRNLLVALQRSPEIEPVLFLPSNLPKEAVAQWRALGCPMVLLLSLVRFRPAWLLRQAARRLRLPILDAETRAAFRRHAIEVTYLRPCGLGDGGPPCVAWTADFQYRHLPEMFGPEEAARRYAVDHRQAQGARLVVLSSRDAARDFRRLFPEAADKARVLNFVAPVSEAAFGPDPATVARRYGLPERFFYFPAQFWRHKNHALVLDGLTRLKGQGRDVVVACSGEPRDNRNPGHYETLRGALATQGLAQDLRLLGLIPAQDILPLMRQSIALLSPSLFEGWSTTVEEAKSLGKRALLSDIAVHREQDPPGATYFDPRDASALADAMWRLWQQVPPGPDAAMEEAAHAALPRRLDAFAGQFLSIMREAAAR